MSFSKVGTFVVVAFAWVAPLAVSAEPEASEDSQWAVSYAGFAMEYARKEVMTGKAYWQRDDKLAYLEEHTFFYKSNQKVKVETVYRWPSGEKFADFVSDYRKHPYIPAYRFRDKRFGRVEGLEWLPNGKIRIFGRKYADRKMVSRELDVPSPGFAGQGLNFFIVDHFDNLINSKRPTEVDFIVPLAQKSYGFRIRAQDKISDREVVLRAEIDNWFIRLFAPSIDVKYDTQKKVLIEYKGPSNLLNEDKDIKPVVIKYDTSELSVQQASQHIKPFRGEASVSSGEAKD